MSRAGTAAGLAALVGLSLALGPLPTAPAAADPTVAVAAKPKAKPKPKPKVTKVSPPTGSTAGGFEVVVKGRGFTGVKRVLVGGTKATGVQVKSSRKLVLTAPAHAAGPAGVRVVTDHGASKATAKATLTYVDPVPALTQVSPRAGPTAVGTRVTLTGRDLTGATGVRFGATPASFTVVSPTTIAATSPARPAGPVSITVQTPGGTASLDDSFTYVAAPTLTAVDPGQGPVQGSTVTLFGTGFTADTTVTFGGVPGADVLVQPDGLELTAAAPPHAAGFVDVAVTTPGGTASLTKGYFYVGDVVLTGVAPAAGPTSGTYTVTLTGSGFTGDTLVTFGVKPARNVQANLAGTSLTAEIFLPNAAGTVDVTVATPGDSDTLEDAFTFVDAPTLTAVNPTVGPADGGQTVTLTGTGFRAGMQVRFGGTAATVLSVDPAGTSATVTTPAHAAGLVDVTVTTPGGTATLVNAYTFVADPTLTDVSPDEGPTAGGQTVTLTGTGFRAGMQVWFGDTPATGLVVLSGTQATVVTPPHAAATVTVTVTTPGGSDALPGAYTYVAAPTLTAVSPTSGPTGGGTTVTLTGSGFRADMEVSFGGLPAAVVSVNPAGTSATVTAPAHPAGAVDVVVTTPGGSATLAGGYTYVAAPTLTGVSPSEGPATGGQAVTLTGSGFLAGLQVRFGGQLATVVSVDPAGTTATVTTPAHAPGVVDVSVTTVGGTGSLPGGYTYVVTPDLASVAPSEGPTAGGQAVTLSGSGFRAGMQVTFGGTPASLVSVNPAGTSATVTTPPHAAGAVDVVVTTPGGSDTLVGGYSYVTAPDLGSLSPDEGPTVGGQSVTLTGTGLAGVTSVTFGGVPAAITSTSATTVEVTAPTHAAGAVDVVVTSPGGTDTLTGGYTYVAAPTLASVAPDEGPTVGGQSVTLTGTGLAGVTSVAFGGAPATITSTSATTVEVTTPVHAAGAVDVVVTSPGGTDTLTGGYTYVVAPTLASVAPDEGPVAGGTTVTLSGTDLGGATSVTFDGVPAAITSTTATTVEVTTPAHAAGPVDVAVTTPGGTDTLAGAFTYRDAPEVTTIDPPVGPAAGGNTVQLLGTGFTGTTQVTFDGVPATDLVVVDDTEVTVTAPAHVAGPVDVELTTPFGSDAVPLGYTYLP